MRRLPLMSMGTKDQAVLVVTVQMIVKFRFMGNVPFLV